MSIIDINPIVLNNVTVITPYRREKECALLINAGKVIQVARANEYDKSPSAKVYDLTGHYVLPGFIDTHIHGGKGFDCTDEAPEALDEISTFHASHGTTSLIATIPAKPKDQLFRCIRRIRHYCENAGPHRIIEGIHLEGPFLNPEMHGAIRPDYMTSASVDLFNELLQTGGNWIRIMSIAPEIPGAMEVMSRASMAKASMGYQGMETIAPLHLSIGHSNARYEEISKAIDCGLEGVTHIFNAMPSMHHRNPGVLGGTLLRDELFVEVIADSVHVHPAILQLLLKVKKHDKIILITDAISASGQPDGEYTFLGQGVVLRNGRAYLADAPDTLSGSTLTMDHAVRTMVKYTDASLEHAAQMASLNPARILEWKYRRGSISVGKDADLVVLDENLQVKMTIKAGRIVYRSDE